MSLRGDSGRASDQALKAAGEDHRLLAPDTGGGTPSSRRGQARRQTTGRGRQRNLARIVLN
jgi:hypothetical protein